MSKEDTIAKLLLDMIPGPEGQISQRSIMHALTKAWDAGYKDGTYHGRMQELRRQTVKSLHE